VAESAGDIYTPLQLSDVLFEGCGANRRSLGPGDVKITPPSIDPSLGWAAVVCTHTLKLPLDGLRAIMNGYLAHSIALLHSIWDGAVFFDTEVLRFHSTAHGTLEHVAAHLQCSSVLPRSTSDLVVFQMADETNGGEEVAAVEAAAPAAAATAMDFATTCG
jgi:hypothetical protein